MDPQREKFLNLKTAPARLSVDEAAWYLGFVAHDIPVLVSNGLLKPLGHPAPNGSKFFAFVSIEELGKDPKWLARATDCIVQHWRRKNARHNGVTIEQPTDAAMQQRGWAEKDLAS